MKRILSTPLRSPVLFHFNVRRSVYDTFGLIHYDLAQQHLKATLLPVINDLDGSIEHRAEKFKAQLKRILERLKTPTAHIVSYSTAGIDARYAISQLGCGEYVRSLTTMGSPHRGSRLADIYEKKGLSEVDMNPISKAMGIGSRSFIEFVPENMRGFNEVVPNHPATKYYSLGGEKTPDYVAPIYRKSNAMLRTTILRNLPYENDGAFGHDQIVWGRHLINFELDHSQLIGVGSGIHGSTFELVLENLRYMQTQQTVADEKKTVAQQS